MGPIRQQTQKLDLVRAIESWRVLRWGTVALPVLFLVIVDLLRHTVFQAQLHTVPGSLLTYAITGAAIVVFSAAVFDLVGRLQVKITEQNRRLSALNSIVVAAAETLHLEDLLSIGLDHVLDAMKADAGLICLVHLEQREHSVACYRGFSPELAARIRKSKLKDDPVADEVVRTGQPVVIERVLEDPRVTEVARREGIRSGISAPLKSEREVNGILVVATRQERHFSAADQEFLEGVGGQLGMVIRNAMLYRQSQLQNRELSALLAVGKAVTSSFELDEVLMRSLDTIIEVTSADAAEIWLTEGAEELVMRCHRGSHREAFLEHTRFRVGEGFPGITAQRQQPIVVHDLPSDGRFLRQGVIEAGFHTFCALPLRLQGRLVGVLAVAALAEDAIGEPWELRLLGGIGEWVALAIENARLHQQVQDVAVLQERERIAREMHDGMGQVLGYVITQTLALKKLLTDGQIGDARKDLADMQEITRSLYADVREGILGLRTSPHRDGGLLPALRAYVEQWEEASEVTATLKVSPEAACIHLAPAAEIQLMRIVQEALSNVRKHARATAVCISFEHNEQDLQVEVADNGQGFDPSRLRSAGWPRFGLQTMRERAESIGGTFSLATTSGEGTRVVVHIPLREAWGKRVPV